MGDAGRSWVAEPVPAPVWIPGCCSGDEPVGKESKRGVDIIAAVDNGVNQGTVGRGR